MGYGHELTAADIAAAMQANTRRGVCDEAGVYIDLGLSTLGKPSPAGALGFHALDTPHSHGTFVLDWRPVRCRCLARREPAARLRCAAQLERTGRRRQQVPGGRGAARLRNGAGHLGRLDERRRAGRPALHPVALRRGRRDHRQRQLRHAGRPARRHARCWKPRWTSSSQLCGGRLQVVLAAGNGYQSRTHANIPLSAAKNPPAPWRREGALDWQVLPDDRTQSFLELWLPPGAQEVQIEITPPGHAALPALGFGESRMWTNGTDQPCCALIYSRSVATGENGHLCPAGAVAGPSASSAAPRQHPAGAGG
jgi:hypothetical protein